MIHTHIRIYMLYIWGCWMEEKKNKIECISLRLCGAKNTILTLQIGRVTKSFFFLALHLIWMDAENTIRQDMCRVRQCMFFFLQNATDIYVWFYFFFFKFKLKWISLVFWVYIRDMHSQFNETIREYVRTYTYVHASCTCIRNVTYTHKILISIECRCSN